MRSSIASAGSAIAPAAPAARQPAWVRPDVGPLTSGYGYRPALGDFHPGIDLAGPYGSPIRAAAAGRIVYAGPAGGFGQVIRIAHPGGIVTVYGHMCRILRRSGHVRAGDVIALEGSEGHSTGPHLHFEVVVHGSRVNPLTFLRRHGVRI
jgi:murein DD-endopeptidase MepM/ murein hydrolase activator NlpD